MAQESDQRLVYSGCYCKFFINFYAFTGANKGIACGLQKIQFIADGEPLGGNRYGKILVAPKHRQVFYADKEIELTRIDFDLLYLFMNNRGTVLTPEQIYNRLWKNEKAESIDDVVKSAIKRLRKKLNGHCEEGNGFIENIREVGYRLPINYEQ